MVRRRRRRKAPRSLEPADVELAQRMIDRELPLRVVGERMGVNPRTLYDYVRVKPGARRGARSSDGIDLQLRRAGYSATEIAAATGKTHQAVQKRCLKHGIRDRDLEVRMGGELLPWSTLSRTPGAPDGRAPVGLISLMRVVVAEARRRAASGEEAAEVLGVDLGWLESFLEAFEVEPPMVIDEELVLDAC